MPRALKPLLKEGLVEEDLGRTPGASRRVKIYSLTPKGMASARRLRSSLLEKEVSWRDEAGELKRDSLSSLLSEINSSLARSGLRTVPLSLLLTLRNDTVLWNDVLYLSNSIAKDEDSSIRLPKGWISMEPPQLPEDTIPMEDEVRDLERSLEHHGMAVVVGPKGSGKRTMVRWWSERSGRKTLWLSRSDDDAEMCMEKGAYDLVVLIGSDMVDIGPLVLAEGKPSLKDPRSEKWPGMFFDTLLIGIQEGELDLEAEGVVKVTDVDESPFVRRVSAMGFPDELALELYRAGKGSPDFMRYLGSLSRKEVDEISKKDVESAVIMLLMGYGSCRDNPNVPQKTLKRGK